MTEDEHPDAAMALASKCLTSLHVQLAEATSRGWLNIIESAHTQNLCQPIANESFLADESSLLGDETVDDKSHSEVVSIERETIAMAATGQASTSDLGCVKENTTSTQNTQLIDQTQCQAVSKTLEHGRGDSRAPVQEISSPGSGLSQVLDRSLGCRHNVDWTLACAMGTGAFAVWGILIKVLLMQQHRDNEFSKASYQARMQDLESLLATMEDSSFWSNLTQSLLKEQSGEKEFSTPSNPARVEELESRLATLGDSSFWINLTRTIVNDLHSEEEFNSAYHQARIQEMESRLAALEDSRAEAIDFCSAAVPNNTFRGKATFIFPTLVVVFGLAMFFMIKRIRRLGSQVATLARQNDIAATESQAKINELESQLRQNDAASQALINDLNTQVETLTNLVCLPPFARQAFHAWQDFIGDVGEVPVFPSNIHDTLDSPCPFCPGKRVQDTHILVLIPASVNEQPFTLNLLGELIQNPRCNGKGTKYSSYIDKIRSEFGEKTSDGPYWILITRDVLEGSRNKSFADQRSMVSRYADLGYEIPSVLEVATAILIHHIQSGERLLSDAPWTYTRCQEAVGDENHADVGGFSSSGIGIGFYNSEQRSSQVGILCCRKL